MAMFIMATNIGGIWGNQMFQESDSPAYTIGWTAILAIESFVVLMIIFVNVMYRWLNKKSQSGEDIVDGKRVRFWL